MNYTQSQSSHKRKWIILLIIVILVVLAMIIFIFLPPGMKGLARKYYQRPLPQLQRNDKTYLDAVYYAAMDRFEERKWKEAIILFDSVAIDHPFYPRSMYYKAHAWIAAGEPEQALPIFKDTLFYSGQYKDHAQWNGVLTKMLLKTPREEIITDLREIAGDSADIFRRPSAEILRKLEK